MNDIENIRREIDDIDHQLLVLLAKRMQQVRAMGKAKKILHLPALQPQRWQAVIADRQTKAKSLGLAGELITTIWECIHTHALTIEENI